MNITVSIQETALSIEQAIQCVQSPAFGAMNLFVGRVRETNLGRSVISVHYDLFVPLAKKVMMALCEEVAAAHQHSIALYLAHFKGQLYVGEISIVIAAGAPHRKEAFSACRAVLEDVKHRAPIWKQEHYTDGMSEWVQGHALCGNH